VALLAAVTSVALAGVCRGDLASRYAAGKLHANRLQSSIQADTTRILGYEGTLSSLTVRLGAIQRSLTIQQRLLAELQTELSRAQQRLVALQLQYRDDRRLLASELLADYESPPPSLVEVIVDSHGFEDLLTQINDLRTVARANAHMVALVARARLAVAAQARRLAQVEARRRQSTAAVLAERDQVAQLRLSIVERELSLARDRAAMRSQLGSLRMALAQKASTLERQAAAAAAQASSSAGGSPPRGGCVNAPFVATEAPTVSFPLRVPTTRSARNRSSPRAWMRLAKPCSNI